MNLVCWLVPLPLAFSCPRRLPCPVSIIVIGGLHPSFQKPHTLHNGAHNIVKIRAMPSANTSPAADFKPTGTVKLHWLPRTPQAGSNCSLLFVFCLVHPATLTSLVYLCDRLSISVSRRFEGHKSSPTTEFFCGRVVIQNYTNLPG